MKKTITVMALLAGAVSVYSQGLVALSDYGGSFTIQIYSAQSAAASTTAVAYGGLTGNEEMGQSANGSLANPGTTVYAAGTALGAGYSVQLLAAAGAGDAIATLLPAGPVISTWYSGDQITGLGGLYQVQAGATTAAIPGAAVGSVATVALAAWNNEGGTVNSLAAAQADGDPWGVSNTGNTAGLGGGIVTPPGLPTSIDSFSLATTVPEPSTIALGVIGASAFLFRRRK